jgi:preprotein translocase subunit SecY
MTAPRIPPIDPELRDKLLFTALAILIYRIGAHITAPTVDVKALSDFIANSAGTGTATLFSLYDALGGGLSRSTIFALGIMPYISASIVIQLGDLRRAFARVHREEAEGRSRAAARRSRNVHALRHAGDLALFAGATRSRLFAGKHSGRRVS